MTAANAQPAPPAAPPPAAPARNAPWLRRVLAHPLTRGLDLDDPATTALRRRIVRENAFLRRTYQDWYRRIATDIPNGEGPNNGHVLELGSGAGFLADYIPGLITSEVFPTPGVQMVVDAHHLPFADGALKAIVMTNVLHHLPDVERFLGEAARAIRPGGIISMIEPWVSPWSRLIYTRLHHEPFDPAAPSWTFPTTGPLSSANGALPWILFRRDHQRFQERFPQWRIEHIRPIMPIRYLLSGGISMRPLLPGFAYPIIAAGERLFSPLNPHAAMFAHIRLRRTDVPGETS
jgi:SAM-dependent methyltransferase